MNSLKFLLSTLALFGAMFLFACSDNESSSAASLEFEISENLDGMVKVFANGASTELGTDAENAKAMDKPKMKVSFDYDFYMGRREVTCGEFNDLMKSETGLQVECDNKELPATNVTYYDALLFANARSKKENRDTAYIYAGATFDENKNCVGLEKLNFNHLVDAYRLPSEAEWVLVASQNWNAEDGWHNGNSGYEPHEVCSAKSGEKTFCDFAGNAMEWVNDWLGKLQDTTVTNYMGAPDGGSIGERVVKGGSFRNDISTINLYSRGDVYTITSASKANYVGFRLAYGKVERPLWLRGDGVAGESRIFVMTSVSEMKSVLGTFRSKLAFRNDMTGNIAFVNFGGGSLSVVEIQDTLDCYHPEISPDGKKVAFSTRYEGVGGKSSLYVRSLNGAGDHLVRLDVESAAIPRWRVLENGDTVIVYVSGTGTNETESAFKEQSTWMVPFSKGKFGMPKKLFDGGYNGGVTNDHKMAVTGAKLLRVNIDGEEDLWYEGAQACNVSLSIQSKNTLFLDFSGKPGREFVGKRYGVHERLFIADSVGNLIQSVASPKGYAFDHSEWAVGEGASDFVIATLNDVNGAHKKIALVNLADSSVVDLVEGEELWHPCLWVEKSNAVENVDLDLDSAGVYFAEGGDWTHEVMRIKMGMFWRLLDSVEILAVGSSRVEDGIIPKEMSSGMCLNMGHPGNDFNASLYVAENYGLNHLPKMKAVVVSLDLGIWQNTETFTDLMFKGEPGYIYDANHEFWKGGLPKGFVQAVESSYPASPNATESYEATLGYSKNASESWGVPLVETDSAWAEKDSSIVPWQLNRLERFVELAAERNVLVVGVIFPQNPAYAETGSWGRYGPTRSTAVNIIKSLKNLEKIYDNFVLLDENKMGAHDYDDSMALNTDHLAYAGAAQITARIDSLLKKRLK